MNNAYFCEIRDFFGEFWRFYFHLWRFQSLISSIFAGFAVGCVSHLSTKQLACIQYVTYIFSTTLDQPAYTHTHTHTRLTALRPGLPGWAGTRKVSPIWILLKQETVSGSEIRWAICKSAPCSRQITMPAPHYSVFYRPDALPATQPTPWKHWRNI